MQTTEQLPKGARNGFGFAVFNTVSFGLTLGAPMMLYFKHLGASATVLGIVAALSPLLLVLQIPAADYVERFGYRAFVLRGWALRTVFILGMAAVPVLPATVTAATRMVLMLFLLFLFNVSRGISVCGWLPWLTQWIPESVRGRYLSREQLCSTLSMLGVTALSAWWLGPGAGAGTYGALFLMAFAGGLLSLVFLRQIPDVPVPPESRSAGAPPWREMLLYPPFLKLLLFNVVVLAAMAGGNVIWIPLMRDHFAASDRYILNMNVVWCLVSALSLLGFGHWVDRVGSRPLLGFAGVVHTVHFLCWSALAAGVLPLTWVTVVLIQGTAAVAMSLFGLANTRLMMAIVPVMGRSHFLALFSVLTSLVAGLLPVFWGLLLDGLTGWSAATGPWEWNQYSLLYAVLMMLMVVSQVFRTRLTEPRAMTTEEFFQELFMRTPARTLSRLLGRRPLP